MSNFVPGLSYGVYTGSLAYPIRGYRPPSYDHAALRCILDLVHPGQFKVLPPSPAAIADKGMLMGFEFKDFFN